ncbi:winged helix-turn-helix domain-containing protein [Pyrobaculum neutrophilum]|uniref:Transcriptional regulator, AsnC family n=1 Tax=Pyrobaculum neutrophilum (strain DSM 2338 / JCM 9278 / NBRC 100436 / V24Sta) TaxID=444157 RepID=B1YDQ7_PYRNV|nr:winged helix-turn-helix domain-containing protein [Pyrobaculum neutrophilum]ACB39920.1 putative transcriptional regulator, AsnC family [Pyrobaculum neutrophilum V24Sta]
MERDQCSALINFMARIYGDDVKWRIIMELRRGYGYTLRELARRVGVTPKSLYKYLDELKQKGIVEIHKAGAQVTIVVLSSQHSWLKELEIN